MLDNIWFLYFGDYSQDTYEFLAEFYRRGNLSVLTRSFLHQVESVLKIEVNQLSAIQHQTILPFSTINDLNEKYYVTDSRNSAIDNALLCIAQLAHYIEHTDKFQYDSTRLSEACIIGASTGLFAAAAIASSGSLSELVSVAVEIVLIAFRTGFYVAAMAGITEDTATLILNDFHKEKVTAVLSSSITISGPTYYFEIAIQLRRLQRNPNSYSIHGPYHAALPLLWRGHYVRVHRFLVNSKPRFPVMSYATGTWYSEQNMHLLIQAIVQDILTERLQFQKILHGCVLKAREHGGRRCPVTPFGPIHAARSLATMLKDESELDIVLIQLIPSEEKSSALFINNKFSNPSKLAIVGMAGRFPGATNHKELWELLERGLDVHREVPNDRFDAKTYTDVTEKSRNTSHTLYGCWIENPGLFDLRFFNMSPQEVLSNRPYVKISLVTAYEALEMAGYVPNRTPSTKLDRIGTFYGQISVRAFGPGRVNYHFRFSACTSLWSGDCDTVVVGGLSCMTNPDIFAGLSRGQFLSRKGPCATFDNDADGYCRADGIGTVIIKRFDDALADKDNVLGLILGTATNHSADAVSITHPHGGTQEVLYRRILDKAAVDPLDIDYGIALRWSNVFAPANRKRGPECPLFLGAVKANIGHGGAASGVTSLIKCLLMLYKNSILPYVGIKNIINKGFPKDLGDCNVHIAFHKTLFRKRTSAPLCIFVNNFSAADGNTGVLLEEALVQACTTNDPRLTHIVAVTTKSKSALIKNAERLIEYLAPNPGISVANLAYITTVRLQKSLKSKLLENLAPVSPEEPGVAFVFTGQGSHYAAIGKDLYENSTVFRENIVEFDRIATVHGFPFFISLIDGSATDFQNLSPVVVQVGIVCLEIALARLWESWGIKPSVVLGHSLGEYAVFCVSGVLSVSDTVYLTGTRAQLLVERCRVGTHAMIAVQGPISSITETLKHVPSPVNIACINSTHEMVLSGEPGEMSNIINPTLDQFEKLAESIPIISFVMAINAVYLRKYAQDIVNFVGGLVSAQRTIFLEIGLHPATLDFAIICAPSLRRNESAYDTISNSLSILHTSGLNIDWNEYHQDFIDSLQLFSLPRLVLDKKHTLSTTTIHTVTREEIDGDIAIPGLREVVTGHIVNGAMLCPSSLYADMAMTICNYAYKLIRPGITDLGIDISNMKVPKPLIAKPDESSQVLKVTATLNAKAGHADLIFSSRSGKEEVEHATCQVFFGSCKDAYLVQSRIDWLEDAEKYGKAHKIGRGLVYKLFSALVDYDPKYRGMQEVILYSDNMEVTSQVVFQATEKDGTFMCSLYWINSVAHISGSIVNASDAIDSRKEESLRIAEQFSADKTYCSYVKMQAENNAIMSGDVFVFDGDKIMAVVEGLKFQCVPRKTIEKPGTRGMISQAPRIAMSDAISDAIKTSNVPMENINALGSNSLSLCSRALDILAAEVGTEIDELVDNIHFADLGIDSLMSLTVSGRMREELEIDVHSHDFNVIQTIGAFKSFLTKFDKQRTVLAYSDSPSQTASLDQSTPNVLEDSNITTPIEDCPDRIEEDDLSIIIRAIEDTTDLSTLGLDSLMSLSILGSLREKTDIALPGDLLTVNTSSPPQHLASSVLLQDHLRKSSKYLWFIPDGGRSATSYVDIPNLLPDLAVLGLNSPYLKTPEEYRCGVIGIASAFITEIKRRQPHGPYLLAGWSAGGGGGVVAFEIVNQLTKRGENVEKLILIDSPCPDIIEPLPSSLHAWFASIGLLGDGDSTKIPSWLSPHFAASVNALSNYTAEKIDHQKCPHVTTIWCEAGICKLPTDPQPEPFPYGHAQFLLDNRTDFGPNLWDKYLDPKRFVSRRMPGNDFTTMKAPHVDILGDIIREAIMTAM
ncbi:hypothetical protein F5884DRAFT_825301 [Xylogone sp. PMI_703]|nr:hypothetical protein F5884DRAFT_825301 [Xylogone sp. PMI_703]